MSLIEPYIHCSKCDSNGFIVKNGMAVECDCRANYRARLMMIKKMMDSNLIFEESSKDEVNSLLSYSLNDYKGKDINQNIPKIKKFLQEFDEKYYCKNLFFTGTNGTQKTTVAKNMAVELLRTNHSVYYILTKDFIDIVMASERDEEKLNLLNQILKVDLLIFEEFSPDKLALYASGYKQSIITSPVKKRFENIGKSTVILSNFSMQELRESSLRNTLVDLIDRETSKSKGSQLVFTDRYGDYAEIDLSSIWED